MRRFAFVTLLVFAVSTSFLALSVFSQAATAPWANFVELTPGAATPGIYDFTVPLEVMDKSREDLADLRLHDANGKEIPYAVRIRHELDDLQEFAAEPFNEAQIGSNASEVSIDLGDSAGEHNELKIETSGTNFRRRVNVEGGDSGTDWKTLITGALIFGFESQNQVVQSNRVSYPASRYKFLRVRVFADELADKGPPKINKVTAVRAVRAKGALTAWNVHVPGYQWLRNQGAPSSAWNIDLGARVPCDRLLLDVDEDSFFRSFQVETGDDPQNLRLVASGELTRRAGEELKPVVILFNEEQYVRKLRLVIADYSNETLPITAIKAAAPARELVFELKDVPAQPLRLYFGNANATAPHYDFEKELSAKLVTTPARLSVGPATTNPAYQPPPLPLTERLPWLIYLVLAISSVALGVLLYKLARSSVHASSVGSEETP